MANDTDYRLTEAEPDGTIRTCSQCKKDVTVLGDGDIRTVRPKFYICWDCHIVWDVKAKAIVPGSPGADPIVTPS